MVLKKHLADDVYKHFLLFYTAICLLSSPSKYVEYLGYANKLLHCLVSYLASVYGSNMTVYNYSQLDTYS